MDRRGVKVRRKNRLGVSEVVSYTLLIALAVGLAAFVTIWYTRSSEQQATGLIEVYETSAECTDVDFKISFEYNECNITVYNTGMLNINQLKAYYFKKDKTRSDALFTDLLIPQTERKIDAMPNLGKLMIVPLLERDGKLYSCPNENVYTPAQDFTNCPV